MYFDRGFDTANPDYKPSTKESHVEDAEIDDEYRNIVESINGYSSNIGVHKGPTAAGSGPAWDDENSLLGGPSAHVGGPGGVGVSVTENI